MNRRGKSVQWVIFMHCSRKRGFGELAGLASRRDAGLSRILVPDLVGPGCLGGFFRAVECFVYHSPFLLPLLLLVVV